MIKVNDIMTEPKDAPTIDVSHQPNLEDPTILARDSERTTKMRARDVSVFYGDKQALNDVSINIYDDLVTAFIATPPGGFDDPATVLPVQIFLWSDEVDRGFIEKTSAAIIVLLLFMLLMNGLAIYLRNRFERRW